MNLINLSLQLNGYAIATAQKQLQELKQQVEHNYADYTETKKTEILNPRPGRSSLDEDGSIQSRKGEPGGR